MRICFISYEFPPEYVGGIGTYVRHAVEMLTARGHEVTVIAGTDGAPSVDLHLGAQVRRVTCTDRTRFHESARSALVSAHAATPFDIVEVPDLYAEGTGLRAVLPNLPIVLRAHTPLYIARKIDFDGFGRRARLFSALRRILGGVGHPLSFSSAVRDAKAHLDWNTSYLPACDPERRVALDADLVVSPSRRLADRLAQDWMLQPEKIRVVPYPHVADPALLALPLDAANDTIAFHGSIRFFKGVHVLAAAMPGILQACPQSRLVLAGRVGASPVPELTWRGFREDRICSWRDTQEWLQPTLNELRGHVRFSGFIRPDRLHEHLRDARVAVFPSLFDNFPNACLEAMAAGRAIVATRSGGMEEMLGPNHAGLLVPPNDPAALGSAVVQLLRDSGLRRVLGSRARTTVQQCYAPSVVGAQHEEVYAEAIERRRIALAA